MSDNGGSTVPAKKYQPSHLWLLSAANETQNLESER